MFGSLPLTRRTTRIALEIVSPLSHQVLGTWVRSC